MDSRSGRRVGQAGDAGAKCKPVAKAGPRALGILGMATSAILAMAGCASHQGPVGAIGATPLSVPATQTDSQAPAPQAASQAIAPQAVDAAAAALSAATVPSVQSGDAAAVADTGFRAPTTTATTTATAATAATAAADVSALSVAHQQKRALLAAYESKLRHDRAVIKAYEFERRHASPGERTNDRTHFLHRMLQDGLIRLRAPDLLAWAKLQRSLADRGALTACSGLRSPQDDQGQAMSINALSVDEVAQYLNLSYEAIHNEASRVPYRSPSKWRVQAAQINLAAQVVALIAQHPEDAKHLAIFEAEGEKKTTANKCWMAALGMRAALRLSDPDRDIILRTLVEKDAH